MTFPRALLIAILAISTLAVAVPQQINYQGTLTSPSGAPLDTTVDITFRLYADSLGSTALWTEIHSDVGVHNGLFDAKLGKDYVIGDAVIYSQSLYLGVAVGGDAEMQPRIRVSSVPYSRLAGAVDSVKATNVSQILQLFQSLPDADGDGHTKVSLGGDDCDDLNPLIHPGATEICDRVDNNCNGQIDEGFATNWYVDADGDGYGDPSTAIVSCDSVPGRVSTGGDCLDNNASFHPGAYDICDLLDNNCDGVIDENGTFGTWYPDADHDGYGPSESQFYGCPPDSTWVSEGGDCDDNNPDVNPGMTEICDGIDQDCDLIPDDNTPGCTVYYFDLDGDGWGDINNYESFCMCAPFPPYSAPQTGDCDDTNPNVHPGVPEICNGMDDNCDGLIDNNAAGCITLYADYDGDGYGNSNDTACLCMASYPYLAQQGGDCDDSNSDVHPGAVEVCNGIDDNCDDVIDGGGSCPSGFHCTNGLCVPN